MFEAAIRGKPLGLGAEDALTATVFGLLRYLPQSVLREWLLSAQPVGHSHALVLGDGGAEVEFWPLWPDTFRGGGSVEPDVLLTLGSLVYVVEAKLHSGQGEDQLAREWMSACDWCSSATRSHRSLGGLLYVTAHLTLPWSDFQQAYAALSKKTCPPPSFYWLPWSRVGACFDPAPTGIHALVAADILRYLDAERLLRFDGWPRICMDGAVWQYAVNAPGVYWEAMPDLPESYWRYCSPSGHYWKTADNLSGSSSAAVWTYSS